MYSTLIQGYGRPNWETSSGVNQGDRNWLQKGDNSDKVKDLQVKLIVVGYSCGEAGADGSFGDATEKAVIAFQIANGLTPDGQAGELPWHVLTACTNRSTPQTMTG